MRVRQRQSLKPHAPKLALPTLNYPATINLNPCTKQIKIQRSSSVASRALLDEFQRALNNTSQRPLDGTLSTSTILNNNRETEPTKMNDSISMYIRNELKEVLKNSTERPFFEEMKNKKRHIKFKSYSRLKEELTNKIHHRLTEPYLQDLTESQTERTLMSSSEVPLPKKPMISPPEPVKIFQNEEINKRIMENYYLKTTITETETDSDSDLSAVSPVEQQLLERSGGSHFHIGYLQPEQPRSMTERGERGEILHSSPSKPNFVRYKKQMYGLYVIGNKPYHLAKSESTQQLNKTQTKLSPERSFVRASPPPNRPKVGSITNRRGSQLSELIKYQEEGSSSLSKNESFAMMGKPSIILVGTKKNHHHPVRKTSETCIQIKRTCANSIPTNI